MKTFKDLEFHPHTVGMGAIAAQLDFPNGYGVSVVKGFFTFDLWELAVLKDGDLCYDTEITPDVIRKDTPEEITELMIQVQKL